MADGNLIRIEQRNVPGEAHSKPLGRHIEHDARSRAFRAPVEALQEQTKVWLRHASPFDQGNLGSCTGNAIVGCAATDPTWVKGKRYTETTAVSVYKRATVLDGFPGTYPPDDTGSSGLAAAKAAVEKGLAVKYLWGFGVDDLVRIVSNIGPAAVGTNWHAGMDKVATNGLVTVTGAVRGGHEYQVVGYHADVSLGAPVAHCFEVQNSWGSSWGVKGTTGGKGGRFFIAKADMGTLLTEGGDCVTLVTDKMPV